MLPSPARDMCIPVKIIRHIPLKEPARRVGTQSALWQITSSLSSSLTPRKSTIYSKKVKAATHAKGDTKANDSYAFSCDRETQDSHGFEQEKDGCIPIRGVHHHFVVYCSLLLFFFTHDAEACARSTQTPHEQLALAKRTRPPYNVRGPSGVAWLLRSACKSRRSPAYASSWRSSTPPPLHLLRFRPSRWGAYSFSGNWFSTNPIVTCWNLLRKHVVPTPSDTMTSSSATMCHGGHATSQSNDWNK